MKLNLHRDYRCVDEDCSHVVHTFVLLINYKNGVYLDEFTLIEAPKALFDAISFFIVDGFRKDIV